MVAKLLTNYFNTMTQRELTIIKQLLTDYGAMLEERDDFKAHDLRRLLDRSLRAIEREQQENRNDHLIDTLKSWLKNTWTYLFPNRKK